MCMFSFPSLLNFHSCIYMEKHTKNISIPHYRYPLEIWPQTCYVLYVYFSFSFALISFSFAFTDGTHAGIDAKSGMKNAKSSRTSHLGCISVFYFIFHFYNSYIFFFLFLGIAHGKWTQTQTQMD